MSGSVGRKPISLVVLYLRTNGTKTYTWHLYRALRMIGESVRILKLHDRTETIRRPYVGETHYRNVDERLIYEAVRDGPTLITTTDAKRADLLLDLQKRGARVVVHSDLPGDVEYAGEGAVLVRKSLKSLVPGGVFIPHPYVRYFDDPPSWRGRLDAVSTTRLDPRKGIDMVLELMRGGAPYEVHLYGDLMPFFGMELDEKFPGWRDQWRGKFKIGDGARISALYRRVIDMTQFARDGQGSQYTTLEAADAGAMPVVHESWAGGELEPGVNCLTAVDVHELTQAVRSRQRLSDRARWEFLDLHAPKRVARRLMRELRR